MYNCTIVSHSRFTSEFLFQTKVSKKQPLGVHSRGCFRSIKLVLALHQRGNLVIAESFPKEVKLIHVPVEIGIFKLGFAQIVGHDHI